MIEWKIIADWLIDYPGVCTPGKLDCDRIRKELSFPFKISSGCTARVQGVGPEVFEFKQPCLNTSLVSEFGLDIKAIFP